MKSGSETVNGSKIQGKEVKKKCSLGFSGDTQHFPANGWIDALKYVLQVGCFPTIPNAVVDDLTVYLVGSNIDERHEQDIPNHGREGLWYPQLMSGIEY